jgi:hypothetical protein
MGATVGAKAKRKEKNIYPVSIKTFGILLKDFLF